MALTPTVRSDSPHVSGLSYLKRADADGPTCGPWEAPIHEGSKTPGHVHTPCYPQAGTRSGHPGFNTRRPPRNSFVPCLGEAVLSHLVRGQCVMVRLPEKTGPAVKLLAGERFLPSGMCLPDGKLLPVVMYHPRPTMRHAEFYHVS